MDLFDLVAKISLDSSDYEKGVNNATGKAGGLAKAIGGGLATAAKVGTAAITAASGAVTALVKSSIDGYAEYEQLVGGLETMFEDLSYDVELNAQKAFKTAGLSANEYMETVMGFSASLNQSLLANEGNIARAADLSDQIITDMADNANKMGTSMESIQNAYAGFAKQNYTMLDNLKLGYGGTKQEMERLLEKAEEIEREQGRTTKFSIENFADIAEAIHIVQDNMGITGTTAEEASKTISGSVAAMKSAWKNLVTGFGDGNADISNLMGDVIESAETALGNILPTVETALGGIASAIENVAPIISEKLPSLVETVLPPLLAAAASLVSGLVAALPSILSAITSVAPTVINGLISAITGLLPSLITSGGVLLGAIGTGILSNLDLLVDSALEVIVKLSDSLIEAIPELLPAVVDVMVGIVDKLTDPDTLNMLIDAALQLIVTLASGLIEQLPRIVQVAWQLVSTLFSTLIDRAPELLTAGLQLVVQLLEGIGQMLSPLVEKGKEVVDKVKEGITSMWEDVKNAGRNIIEGIWEGISNTANWLWEQVSGFFGDLLGKIKDFLGIHSPSKVFAGIGDNMAAGIGVGFDRTMDKVERDMMSSIPIPDVSANVGLSGVSGSGGVGNQFVIGFDIDVEGLVRYLRPYIKDEDARIGGAMVV